MIIPILLGLFICCLIVMAVFVYGYRKKALELTDQILQKLDTTLSGNTLELHYDESMDSAIADRLNRIVQMTALQTGRAEKERDVIKSLISDITHQVRTPLSNIVLYAGLIQESELSDTALALADKIVANSDHLNFFMKELVKLSYAEQTIVAVRPQHISVEALLASSCQTVELAALKKQITICRERVNINCYADLKWTTEAIGAILENAVKYSPEYSNISITTSRYDSFVCVQVTDTGIGIAEEEQGRIFQRFYRGNNVQNNPGYGIGLYLAREVLSKQGGYLKVNSNLNKGTTVHIYLSRRPIT